MPILQRKTLTIILGALLVWIGYKVWHIRIEKMETNVQLGEISSRVADLERNNNFLASSSAYFSSEVYLERQARLKLNYKFADEQVAFVYKDTSVKIASSSDGSRDKLSGMPSWKQWWYYLLGY
jgi:cell division protein FtsB